MNEPQVQEFVDAPAGEAPVRGWLHLPAVPSGDGLVLTHGAGANCQSPLLTLLADAFCRSGLTVLRCDLPFRQLHAKGPPLRGSAEKDREGLRRAVATIRPLVPGRVLLGGHSYGGRQASMLAAAEPGLSQALLLLSYPLHPPKRPQELRTAHFPCVRTPAMFVQGSRDGFATLEEIAEVIELIPARTKLLPIAGAGHELLTARNREALAGIVVEAFEELIRG